MIKIKILILTSWRLTKNKSIFVEKFKLQKSIILIITYEIYPRRSCENCKLTDRAISEKFSSPTLKSRFGKSAFKVLKAH